MCLASMACILTFASITDKSSYLNQVKLNSASLALSLGHILTVTFTYDY